MTASLADVGQVDSRQQKRWERSLIRLSTTFHQSSSWTEVNVLDHFCCQETKKKKKEKNVLTYTWKQFLNGYNNKKNNDDNDNT